MLPLASGFAKGLLPLPPPTHLCGSVPGAHGWKGSTKLPWSAPGAAGFVQMRVSRRRGCGAGSAAELGCVCTGWVAARLEGGSGDFMFLWSLELLMGMAGPTLVCSMEE